MNGIYTSGNKPFPGKLDVDKIVLWQSKELIKNGHTNGINFIKEFKDHEECNGSFFLNASILDFLLDHPDLIPKEWKQIKVLFLGTIYLKSNRHFFRYLYFSTQNDRWESEYQFKGYVLSACHWAAISINS